MLFFTAHWPIALTCSTEYTDPVGFDGEQKSKAFVFGVRAASSCSTDTK
jgi:hypothetical protein